MKNIGMTVKGNTLTLTIDLSKRIGPSSSGKTVLVASSEGNAEVPGTDLRLGLNVFAKPASAKSAAA